MRSGLPLYPRLAATLLIALAAGMLIAWWIAVVLFSRAFEQRVVLQLRETANVLASGLPFTPELVGRLARLQRSEVILVDAEFKPRLATLSAVPPELLARARTESRAPASPGAVREFSLDLEGLPQRGLVRELPANGDPRYRTLIAVSSLADAQEAVRRAATALGLALLAAMGLTGLIALRLVHGITRPLQRLADMARRIAAGERGLRAGVSRGDEIGTLAAALDDMSRRLAQYEAELADRSRTAALGEMAARVAHEIRNPLTGMKMHLQLLEERLSGPDRIRLGRVLDEIRRLELVVGATLEVGRDTPLNLEAADVGAIVQDVVQLMQPALAHRHVTLETQLSPGLSVRIDRDRMKQVLLNLLTNAADALPGGGRIRISLAERGASGRPELAVEDSGAGIEPALRERIFDGASRDKPMGLGIGLRLSRELVRRQGCILHVEASTELGGARFVICFGAAPAVAA